MIKCLMERQILCIMSSFHIKADFFPVSCPHRLILRYIECYSVLVPLPSFIALSLPFCLFVFVGCISIFLSVFYLLFVFIFLCLTFCLYFYFFFSLFVFHLFICLSFCMSASFFPSMFYGKDCPLVFSLFLYTSEHCSGVIQDINKF